MITLIGFDGPEPHSVIYWVLNGQECSKTICYSPADERSSIERFNTTGDLYNRFDKAVIVKPNGDTYIEEELAHAVEG